MFVQLSLQPKLSRRPYAGVPYALQNNTVFRRAQNWVNGSNGSRTDNGSNGLNNRLCTPVNTKHKQYSSINNDAWLAQNQLLTMHQMEMYSTPVFRVIFIGISFIAAHRSA